MLPKNATRENLKDLSWGHKPIDKSKYGKHDSLCHFIASPDVSKKQRQAVLGMLTPNQIGGIGELSRDWLFHNPQLSLTPESNKRLRAHKKFVIDLANPKVKVKCKKEGIVRHGGFLPFLLRAAGPLFRKIAFPLVGKVLTKILKKRKR